MKPMQQDCERDEERCFSALDVEPMDEAQRALAGTATNECFSALDVEPMDEASSSQAMREVLFLFQCS